MPLVEFNFGLFTPHPIELYSELLNTKDSTSAYVEDSNHWNKFMIPQMKYYSDPKLRDMELVLASSYLRIYFRFDLH